MEVRGRDHPWESRGGVKLAHGLDHFGIDPAGMVAIDVGSSTGYILVTTWSAHYRPDPNFRRADDEYLEREKQAVAHEQEYLGEMTPFRRDAQS